jgi:hypothetical protein
MFRNVLQIILVGSSTEARSASKRQRDNRLIFRENMFLPRGRGTGARVVHNMRKLMRGARAQESLEAELGLPQGCQISSIDGQKVLLLKNWRDRPV